jgi:BirA family biotin operon repressor/biotin-[acetyl-CoA-carboxylase] ligase
VPDERYAGRDAATLRALLDLPRVEVRETVTSTLDVAHELAAAGAPAGTLVLAERQRAGRGRGGRTWSSEAGAGIWLTLIERPTDGRALELLSLRVGVRAAPVLERYAGERVLLKWPNDLFTARGKLGGVLVEARWREERAEWVAIGVGINVHLPPGVPGASALGDVDRVAVLGELIPALRGAAAARGPLTPDELARFAERDLARGRRVVAPAHGIVRGIDEAGALLVEGEAGVVSCRSGSLEFTAQAR